MKKIYLKNNPNFIIKFLDIPLIIKEDNPITKFFITFSTLLKIILNFPLFTKYLFKLVNYIHALLYQTEEIIYIDIQKITNISFYFYLDLLIKYEENIVNYEYSMEIINKLNQIENNNDKNYFYKTIKSKIVLDLLSNFKATNSYNSKYDQEIEQIQKNNIKIIKKYIYIFSNNKINLNDKDIFIKGLEEIYIEIINSLIKNNKLNDYNYTINILKQLDVENIDLTLLMFNEISKTLNENEKYINEQKILTKEDLFSEEKINFHYILLKFIFKNSLYIYNIPFLTQNRQNIINIIKSNNIFKDLSLMQNDDLKERLKFIVKAYSDSAYYYSLFLKGEIINDIDNINPNIIQNTINLSSGKSTEKSLDILKSEAGIQIIGEKEKEKSSKIDTQAEYIIPYLLLNKATIKIHTNEKGKEPYIIYEEILISEQRIKINYNNLISFENSNDNSILIQNYKYFLAFLKQFENNIKDNFKYNYKLEIKLEFKRNNLDKKPVYDIECKYLFYAPEKSKEIITFKDESIFNNLKNKSSQGLTFLTDEINNESFKDIKYHDNFPINSTLKNENKSSKQFTIEEYKIDNKINKEISKKLSDYKIDNFSLEEKILEFDEIIYKHKKTCDFIFQLSDGTLVSGGKDNTLVIYVERLKKKIEMNLEQYPYSISEKISDNENIVEMILCCEKNFILIKINTEDNSYNIETFLLPNIYSFYYCELTKGNYIISGESKSINIINLFDEAKEPKIIKEFVQNETYFSGIIINKDIVALISNRVIPKGVDKLIFYNLKSEKISVEIKGFSFNYSFTSLSLISINKNELNYNILLCACKKYYPNQKNGILMVNLQLQDKEEVESQFYPTNNFEVYCFCQILNFKRINDENNLNDSQYEVEYEETNYFFIGGFDEEKREGKIKLYKVLYGLKASLTKIKYLQDIEFDESKDFDRFESPICSIIQSKINGKIAVSCWDGNVYLFSIPNIHFYLKEEK